MCSIKPIRTEAEYEAALARVSRLADAAPGSPEAQERDLLADLAELYEYDNIPIPPTQGRALIWSWIDQKGLTIPCLNAALDGQGDIEAALDGKQDLTPEMVEILHRQLGVPVEKLLCHAAL